MLNELCSNYIYSLEKQTSDTRPGKSLSERKEYAYVFSLQDNNIHATLRIACNKNVEFNVTFHKLTSFLIDWAAASTNTKSRTGKQNKTFQSDMPSSKMYPAALLLLQILEAPNDSPESQINDSKPTEFVHWEFYYLKCKHTHTHTQKRLLHVEVLSDQNISP